jgi:ketopantoate reductase
MGAGAMGSLLVDCLPPGEEVWLVDIWKAHIEAIQSKGSLLKKKVKR